MELPKTEKLPYNKGSNQLNEGETHRVEENCGQLYIHLLED